jgi:hypothetical protein
MSDQVPASAGIVVVVGGVVVAEEGTVVVEGGELLVELPHAAATNASVPRSNAAARLVFTVTQSRLASPS